MGSGCGADSKRKALLKCLQAKAQQTLSRLPDSIVSISANSSTGTSSAPIFQKSSVGNKKYRETGKSLTLLWGTFACLFFFFCLLFQELLFYGTVTPCQIFGSETERNNVSCNTKRKEKQAKILIRLIIISFNTFPISFAF